MSKADPEAYSILSARIGSFIAQLREASGLSQNQLAIKAGINRSTLNRLEEGVSTPSTTVLVKLTEALDLDYSQFAELLGLDNTRMLPEPAVYFRTKYALTDAEAATLDEQIRQLAKEHSIDLEPAKDNPKDEPDTT
jgi:transcriptional regulator with XRE-family HTH domain